MPLAPRQKQARANKRSLVIGTGKNTMAYGEKLIAYLGLDTAGFKTGLTGAESALSSFVGKIGLGFSIVGLANSAREIIAYGSTIQDLSDRFDVSTTALQQFGNAGELVGTSLEGVARAFNKLELSRARALQGSEAQVKAFADLGISLQDLQALSPDQLMQKLGKSSLNAADLVKVLGKNALEIRPLLAGLGDESIRLGDAIDEGLIRQLDAADDSIKKFYQGAKILGGTGLGNFFQNADAGVRTLERLSTALSKGDIIGSMKALVSVFGKEAKLLTPGLNFLPSGDETKTPGKKQKRPGEEQQVAETPAQRRAAQKEKERTQLSLSDLAALDPSADVELRNNIQASYASQQARNVQGLEAGARRQVELNDPEGARRTLSRADEMRQSIGNLKDSEKQIGTWVIDDSTTGKAVQDILQEFRSGGD
jgi:hypothetical protein